MYNFEKMEYFIQERSLTVIEIKYPSLQFVRPAKVWPTTHHIDLFPCSLDICYCQLLTFMKLNRPTTFGFYQIVCNIFASNLVTLTTYHTATEISKLFMVLYNFKVVLPTAVQHLMISKFCLHLRLFTRTVKMKCTNLLLVIHLSVLLRKGYLA